MLTKKGIFYNQIWAVYTNNQIEEGGLPKAYIGFLIVRRNGRRFVASEVTSMTSLDFMCVTFIYTVY